MEQAVATAEKEESATVRIEAAKGEDVFAVNVQIPVTGLASAAKSKVVKNIRIVSPVGDITQDTPAIDDLITAAGGAGGVEIALERKDDDENDSEPTEAQTAALEDLDTRGVYDIHIVIGKSEAAFNTETGNLTVGLPYILRTGEIDERVVVVYIDGEGAAEPTEVVKREEGKAFFNTRHLSLFAVTYEEPASGPDPAPDPDPDPDPNPLRSGGGCDAGLGLIGIFGAAGAMVFARGIASAKRRRSR